MIHLRQRSATMLMAAVWCCTAGFALAADYYVSTTGNDSAAGTLANPWRTIQRAVSSAGAGDTVHIRGGVYAERVSLSGKSGTVSRPIVIRSHDSETAIIDQDGVTPPNGTSALLRLNNCSHITIQGLELRNYKASATNKTPIGIYISGGGTGVKLLQNRVHGIWQSYGVLHSFAANAHGILVAGNSTTAISGLVIEGNEVFDLRLGASEALVLNGNVTGFTVRGNIVRDCNNIGIDFIGHEGTNGNASLDVARNGICVGNTVYNIDSQFNPAYGGNFSSGGGDSTRAAAGIYVDGGANIVIERNHVYQCNFGIEVGCENTGHEATGIVVRNNLVRRNHVGGIFIGGYDESVGGTSSSSFTHNTLYQNDTSGYGGGQIALQHNISSTRIRHNIVVGNSATGQFILNTNATSSFAAGDIDWNLYSGFSSASAEFIWRDQSRTGFAAWRSASGQDVHSSFAASVGFVNAAGGDFTLTAGSAAVDTGDPGFLSATGEVDFHGRARVFGTKVDIGMAEHASPITGAPQAGTLAADQVTYSSVTLRGVVNPVGLPAEVWFEYGTTAALGQQSAVQSIAAGTLDVPVDAVLTGLTHRRKYYFRVVASSQIGMNVGRTLSFSTSAMPAPLILTHPASVLAYEGEAVSFAASADGGQPLEWRWRRNGESIPGSDAASDRYDIAAADFGKAGNYAVRVFNAADDAVSKTSALVVVSRADSSRVVGEGDALTLKADMTGPGDGLEFEWTKDGEVMRDDGRVSGSTTSRLVFRSTAWTDVGKYRCRIRLGALERFTGFTDVGVRPRPVMHPFTPSSTWMVSGVVDEQVAASNEPKRFTIRGLPPGLVFDPLTGRISGRPMQAGNFTLFITASNDVGTGAPVTTVVTVMPLPEGSTGLFHGLIDRNAAASQNNLGGRLQIKVSAAGTITGRVVYGKMSHSFTGRLDAKAGMEPTASVPISRGLERAPLTLQLRLNSASGTGEGDLSEPLDGGSVGSGVNLIRQDWHSSLNPATGRAGRYTALLNPPPELEMDPSIPHGSGFATITIGKDGKVQLSGVLADGVAWSHSTVLNRSGLLPLHAVSTEGSGSILGWLSAELDPASAYQDNTVNGLVSWYRASAFPKPRRIYGAGIPEHKLTLAGSRWVRPSVSERLLNLGAPEDSARLELVRSAAESASPAVLPVRVKQDYRAVVQVPGTNPVDVSLKLSPTTGLFSGAFTLLDPDPWTGNGTIARRTNFRGLILRKQLQAGGFFLLPALPVPPATLNVTPITSGRVLLVP